MPLTPVMAEWVDGLFTKIVLTVETEADLLRVHELAQEAGIPTALVTDAGKTEFRKPCPDCDTRCEVHRFLMPDGRCSCGRPDRECKTCKGRGVPKPTHTAVAIGPAEVEAIDRITGPEGAVPTRLP